MWTQLRHSCTRQKWTDNEIKRLWLAMFIVYMSHHFVTIVQCADVVIEIRGNSDQEDSFYRLDYAPPFGNPPPNTTIAARDIRGDVIQFSQGLPGTKYDFRVYYTNATVHDWLTWTASITTAPDPPSNLSVSVRGTKSAIVSWSPPRQGSHSGYRMKLINFNAKLNDMKKFQTLGSIEEENVPYTLKELVPGASYQVQVFTMFDSKESVAYISRNFTTKPNTPGKFIVWFRNETTLLVLWQPPYPAGVYTHYKVSIEPSDAQESVLYVEKEGEPPGPAQAAFKGLTPGRAYNISVQTISEEEISAPTTAQYRTVPLRVQNISFEHITSYTFKVVWEPPKGKCEFDKYQVSFGSTRKSPLSNVLPTRLRDEDTWWEFRDNLEPGRTYQVLVKTIAGKVNSWPVSANVTLLPLPVFNLTTHNDDRSGVVTLSWSTDNSSSQDYFKVTYRETDIANGDSNDVTTDKNSIELEYLLPGRLYDVAVQAVSNKMESTVVRIDLNTKPSAPIIEDLKPIPEGLNISWKSDVNSKQDRYELTYVRNDTNETKTISTKDTRVTLTKLYPGAGYAIKVFAVSHEGLKSEPHRHFQAVLPKPPINISIERVTSTSVIVHWEPPTGSIFTEYAIRYRTDSNRQWVKLPPVRENEAEVTDMTPGERYTIQVNTVSFGFESTGPLQVNQTIRPNPVTNIVPLLDSSNITLEWPRPEGRVETYIIKWWETDNDGSVHVRNVSQPEPLSENVNVQVLITDLMPGIQYSFQIRTVSNGLESDVTPLTERTMPLIQSELVVINNPQVTDAISLRYTLTPQTSSHFDMYRFALSDPNVGPQEKSANDTDQHVKFSNLTPGKLYNITVWTVSHGTSSQPLQRQDRLYPEPVTFINATNITDTEITLMWGIPRGEFNAFEVQYLTNEGILIQNLTLNNFIMLSDLKPHRNYTFTIIVRSGTESSVLRRSLPLSAIFTTKESVPGKVDRFHPVDIHPSDIMFEWALPSTEQNGIIQKFTIAYGLEGLNEFQVVNFTPEELSGVIRNLLPGKSYEFKIQAETRVGFGPETVWKQRMPILAPPRPSPGVVPTEVHKTSTSIQIRFRKNYFSEANGPVILYTLIVAEDDSKNASGLEMPSWRDVQAYSVWPPYQVMDPYYPFQNSSVEDFTVGSSTCDLRQTGYCNGALKPGSTYRVKIRAFTAPDKFTDTSYSFPITTDADNTPIVIAITIIIALLIMVCIGVFLLRKRRTFGRKTAETRQNDAVSIPDSVIDPNRPVVITKFADHYRIMSADSDFRFSEEFEELKHVGRDQPCTFADLPCNRPKNRFTNILPYDHSRYKLQPVDDEEGSDYINANYVPGFNSPREFIVTQGPLHSTRDDFWRMCWESNSRAIVMLTRCIEKGREKCDHYWPYDTMPVYYGDISVQIMTESHYSDWNVTEFMVCRGDTQRVITHFHFTTWPDFGVPNPSHILVRFVRAFRDRIRPDQRPIVVHCSAGVGRSGTFIALDRIIQQIHVTDFVDIFGIVWAMRKERVWMVQTEQQYICIHQCLLTVLEGNELTGTPREIHDNEGYEDDEGIAESGM